MPSHALWAYQQERVSQELTVMDVCETPLFLTRWYAERQGVSVATACSDVLEYEPDMTFDVAMTNSFLGSFAPDRRPALFASWARVLRPGGKLLFTNRIRPDAEGISRFGPEEIEAFCQTVERGATNLPPQLGADIDWIASSARTYAERYFSYPVTSTEEIVQLLEAAGFYVDRLQVAHHGGRPGGPVSGPTTNQSADYARVLATRL
jgi:SAM-dependent methyltransferase